MGAVESKAKKTMYVHLKNNSPMVIAGLWEHWKFPEVEVVESCIILTTNSNKLIAPLHKRMSVVLHPVEIIFDLTGELV